MMAFRMSGTTSAIWCVCRIFRLCADVLGTNPSSSMACITLSRVLLLMPSELLMARDTVAMPTPARSATSLIVSFCSFLNVRLPHFIGNDSELLGICMNFTIVI